MRFNALCGLGIDSCVVTEPETGRMSLPKIGRRHTHSGVSIPQLSSRPRLKLERGAEVGNHYPALPAQESTPSVGCSMAGLRHEAKSADASASTDPAKPCGKGQDLENGELHMSGVQDCSRPVSKYPPEDNIPIHPAADDATAVNHPATDNSSSSPPVTGDSTPPSEQSITELPTLYSESTTDEAIPAPQTPALNPADTEAQRSMPSMHLTAVADDCFVDVECSLPSPLFHEWTTIIHQRLRDKVYHSLPDAEITIECVMAQQTKTSNAKPTIVLMYSDQRQKKQLERILRDCKFYSRQFDRKAIMLDTTLCASGESSAQYLDLQNDELLVGTAISEASKQPTLFARLVKIYPSKGVESSVFSTMGGVISVDGTCYGLTTAHGLRTMGGTERQQITNTSGTVHE